MLYRLNAKAYRTTFKKHFAFDAVRKHEVLSREEMQKKMEAISREMGKVSRLEESAQFYHYFRATGYVVLRKDGSEYLFDKMFRAAVISGVLMAQGDKDMVLRGLKMTSEADKK